MSSTYFIRVQLSLAYYFNNNPSKALETAEAAISKFPNDFWVLQQAIRINNYAGKYKNAVILFEKYKTLFPSVLTPFVYQHAAIAYYKTGSADSSEIYLGNLKKLGEQTAVRSPSFFLAAAYMATGKSDLAIQSLEKAFRNHEVEMYWLKVEPLFKPLYGDARFQKLVNRIGY
jgi:tetratricopeptide (TPR) repeat protein